MSGIYIPGMEMPDSCFRCKLISSTDMYMCRAAWRKLTKEHGINISRPSWCPLIPVPDHGRLIDADSATFPTPHRKESNDYMKGWNTCLRSVMQQPTIIPADQAKEGET